MLLCISGSLRREATNRTLLAEAARLFGGPSLVADLRMPLYDADLQEAEGIPGPVLRLAAQIAQADAVVISSPEYNQSISGVLKNALDWVSRTEGAPWRNKPLAMMSASSGRSGGARGLSALRLAMVPYGPRFSAGPEVMLAGSKTVLASGRLEDPRSLATLTAAMEILRREAGL
ncbi:NADPH-dependent FMN reductase [Profundibacterium mesophilum]|uniref:Cystine reductase n=1 Tax=Profundibacterium mesophilum KAUST100406-0324 TaxID=1037889 RepID=A0A921NXU4_9RHOB|nr:NAD(P)H-dependent oxidoreductase [Profundibacterium mesophilum]KAF0675503.1 cystine reductase [Profundibacterium mesophilum KAUST100406-0324]